jgi:hypothetical protein
MSHRLWWLITLFALAIGAAMEFEVPLPGPEAQSAAQAAPATVAAQPGDPSRS